MNGTDSMNDGGSPQYDPADTETETDSNDIVPFSVFELETPFQHLTFDLKVSRIVRLKECEWSLVRVDDEATMNLIAIAHHDILSDTSAYVWGGFPPPSRRSIKKETDLAYDALKAYLRCLRFNAEWCRRRNPVRVYEELPSNPDEWELRAELAKRLKSNRVSVAHCLAEVLMQGIRAYEMFDQLRDYDAIDVATLFDRCPQLSIY